MPYTAYEEEACLATDVSLCIVTLCLGEMTQMFLVTSFESRATASPKLS